MSHTFAVGTLTPAVLDILDARFDLPDADAHMAFHTVASGLTAMLRDQLHAPSDRVAFWHLLQCYDAEGTPFDERAKAVGDFRTLDLVAYLLDVANDDLESRLADALELDLDTASHLVYTIAPMIVAVLRHHIFELGLARDLLPRLTADSPALDAANRKSTAARRKSPWVFGAVRPYYC